MSVFLTASETFFHVNTFTNVKRMYSNNFINNRWKMHWISYCQAN